MKINNIIKEKRMQKNLTQEQIAQCLGVSTPAVNKWEKGISYPDITLLPPLARLLDTDLNTLLSFSDDLTPQEIGMFLNELSSLSEKEDFNQVYNIAIDKIHEFLNSFELILSIASLLDGILILDKKGYSKQYSENVDLLYKQVLCSENMSIRNQAQSILIHKYINRKDYDNAEELLKDIPDKMFVDKRRIQAKLFTAYNQLEDAALIEEERLLTTINEIHSILLSLMNIALKDNRIEDAKYIANVSKESAKIFDMLEYSQYVAHFQLYTETKNRIKTLKVLLPMLKSLSKKWDIHKSPLYRHIKTKNNTDTFNSRIQKEILESIYSSKETEFLKDDPELRNITKEISQDYKK